LNNFDTDKVRELRTWSKTYFTNELVYEGTMFMPLMKVRECIQNEFSKALDGPLPYEREYCIVVKIEEIESLSKNEFDQPSSEMVCLRVTDSSNLLFSVIIPKILLPKDLKIGDVTRITKVSKSQEG
jgi:hypothetical protein